MSFFYDLLIGGELSEPLARWGACPHLERELAASRRRAPRNPPEPRWGGGGDCQLSRSIACLPTAGAGWLCNSNERRPGLPAAVKSLSSGRVPSRTAPPHLPVNPCLALRTGDTQLSVGRILKGTGIVKLKSLSNDISRMTPGGGVCCTALDEKAFDKWH